MPTNFVIPSEQELKNTLGMLFGDDTGVSSDNESANGNASHFATYVDDDDTPVVACSCDLPFAAYSAAALTMIPADVANDAIKGNDLSEMMIGNLYEVMNICSTVLMNRTSPHLRLEKLHDIADAESREQVTEAHYTVDIPQYGSGKLSFLYY